MGIKIHWVAHLSILFGLIEYSELENLTCNDSRGNDYGEGLELKLAAPPMQLLRGSAVLTSVASTRAFFVPVL